MPNRTALFSRHQPGGVFTIADLADHPGSIFFVNSTGGVNSVGGGQNPDTPLATVDYAIGLCTASVGDVIYVMPGHTESLTAAAAIACDVAGISVIGLGVGDNRPIFTFASADNSATWTVSADDVRIHNIVAVCNDDALTNAFVVTGDGFDLDIEFQDTSSLIEAATAIRLDTANNGKLKLKYLGFTGGDAVVSAVRIDDCDNVVIVIDGYGVVTTAWVEMVDVASTNVSVRGRVYTQAITNFTRDVVDTIGTSKWDTAIFDASAGFAVSGGSASALASDDVTALATAISVIDEFHDVPAANNVLNAQINEVIGNKTDATATGAVTTTDTLVGYVKQLVTELAVVDEFHDVPAADNVLNAQINEVIGNKTDTAASGVVTTTDTLVGYVKQLVTELAVVDEFHDVPAADNVLNAQINEVIGNKTDAAAAGAVTATDTLVGYVKQLVTELAIVDEFHDVPAADNVLNAQINEVIGNKTDTTAAGDVTTTDTVIAYLKQLVTELSGTAGIPTWPSAAKAANTVSIAEALRYITQLQSPQLATVTSASPLTTGTLFTFTGSIEIIHLIGRVTTVIQGQATTVRLYITPDALAAYNITGATGDINGDLVGTLISITGTAAADIVDTTGVGAIAPGQANPVVTTCVTNGVIGVTYGAASTGAIVWEMLWRPLSTGATVS